MSQMRRYSAAFLGAFALVLGACGGNTPTTPAEQTTGSVGDNPLLISLTPGAMAFSSVTATAPTPQTLMTTGLVAIGSSVGFGAISYDQAVTPWLRVDPRPTFQREPLAWLNTVSIDQAAYGTLANGVYTAWLPVVVIAAQNSPQMLGVVLCKGTGSCLAVGSDVMADLSGSDPTWNRGSDLNAPGGYYYDDYWLVVPAMSTVHLLYEGSSCGAGKTLGDPYIYAFDANGVLVGQNDDGLCGLNSYLPVTNNTSSTQAYRIRATTWSGGTGTYRLRATSGAPTLRAGSSELTAHEQEVLRQKAAASR